MSCRGRAFWPLSLVQYSTQSIGEVHHTCAAWHVVLLRAKMSFFSRKKKKKQAPAPTAEPESLSEAVTESGERGSPETTVQGAGESQTDEPNPQPEPDTAPPPSPESEPGHEPEPGVLTKAPAKPPTEPPIEAQTEPPTEQEPPQVLNLVYS